MRITEHGNDVYGNRMLQGAAGTEKKQEKKEGCVIRGKDSEIFQNPLEQKKKEAREKAMKVVSQAWEGDLEIDNDLQERREKIGALREENTALSKQVEEISTLQEKLREQYGISQDSREQKDLELLRKEDRYRRGEGPALTKEEQERVTELKKEGLTEYQKRQREWDSQKKHFQGQIDENNKQILQENAIIRGTKLERLKSSPMVKAQKEADAILQQAGKEIIGMILEEAKDTIDKEQEEEQEKAEALEEEQEKKKEFIEKQKEKRDETEEILTQMPMEELMNLQSLKKEVRQEVEKIVNDMKLVAEDIKGAMVDQEV